MSDLLSQDSIDEILREFKDGKFYHYLTAKEALELDLLLATSKKIWEPVVGPQMLAYHSPADELFYGGQAGGGKSDLLLGLAITAHKRSVILRREQVQLGDLILRSHELLGDKGRYNSALKIWKQIPGGRHLEFCGCELEEDKIKHKGRARDFYGFDEAADFTETQYLFITAWNRSTVPGQRCRVVCASNPPTSVEGEWMIRRWAAWIDPSHPNPARPGELRWYVRLKGGEEREVEGPEEIEFQGERIKPKSRTFIPAKLSDNPYLRDTGYAATLQALPEPLRSQLLYGDFMIGRGDDPWQLLPTDWVRAAMDRWTPEPPKRYVPVGEEGEREEQLVPMTCMGVDVAHGGDNRTVIATRRGWWYAPLVVLKGTETPDGQSVAGQVCLHREDDCYVHIDAVGWGSSVVDILQHDPRVIGVNFSSRTKNRDKSGRLGFTNVRAEAYWKFRELLEPGSGAELALPPDPELLGELCSMRWTVQVNGIKIESKEEVRKRLGKSPDKADAVVLAAFDANPFSVEYGPKIYL